MNNLLFVLLFLIAAIFSYFLTFLARKIAAKFELFDRPAPRKIHHKPIPRLGGIAIFLSFIIIIKAILLIKPDLMHFSNFVWWGIIDKRLFGVLLGGFILVMIGAIDDIKGLSPLTKLFWQIIAAGVVIASGVSIDVMRNPLGGHLIHLTQYELPFSLSHHTYHFVLWGDVLIILWIVLMINIVNFLDGLDGLAAGVSLIAFLTLFFLSLSPEVNQLQTAILCLALAGAIAGFLPKNFYPARIFMGDSGSMFLGFMLAVAAVISGGKLATSFLVLGFPILDGLWVIGRRLINKKSPFLADKKHLHHRLLQVGLTQKQAVLAIYILTAAFGVVAAIGKTREKLWAFIILLLIMVLLASFLVVVEWKKEAFNKNKL